MRGPLKLERPWEEVKDMLKEININLTDEDLAYEPGREDELLTRLSEKLKMEPEAVKEWIESASYNKGKAG